MLVPVCMYVCICVSMYVCVYVCICRVFCDVCGYVSVVHMAYVCVCVCVCVGGGMCVHVLDVVCIHPYTQALLTQEATFKHHTLTLCLTKLSTGFAVCVGVTGKGVLMLSLAGYFHANMSTLFLMAKAILRNGLSNGLVQNRWHPVVMCVCMYVRNEWGGG